MNLVSASSRTCPEQFPFIPTGVPMLQVGRAYNAYDNRAYVRQLLKARMPALSDRLEHAVDTNLDELNAGVITLSEAVFNLRII